MEHVVCHVGPHPDAVHLVEVPVDAEVNPALAVLFHRLAEAREVPLDDRAHVAVLVAGVAVELVGTDGEAAVVGKRAPPKPAGPEGYAGNGGVKLVPEPLSAGAPSGVQVGSPTVCGL